MKNILLNSKRKKWDINFLRLAKFISSWSKDPSTKVGAVIVDDDHRIVLGLGYNGFPRYIPDDDELYLNKDKKYKLIVHAEINAILNCSILDRNKKMTIYIWPLFSCNECAKAIIQSNIRRVVSVKNEKDKDWNASISKYMYDNSGVEYYFYDEKDI